MNFQSQISITMNKLYFILFLFLGLVSCGSDDPEPEPEPETTSCGGELAITVDAISETYGTPLSATLVELNLSGGTELLVVWMNGNKSINLQVFIGEIDLDCFPT